MAQRVGLREPDGDDYRFTSTLMSSKNRYFTRFSAPGTRVGVLLPEASQGDRRTCFCLSFFVLFPASRFVLFAAGARVFSLGILLDVLLMREANSGTLDPRGELGGDVTDRLDSPLQIQKF